MRWILSTLPPYFSCRSDCYVIWRQRSIFRWMPFAGKVGETNASDRSAVINSTSCNMGNHFLCLRVVLNSRFPFVLWIFGAAPPNFLALPHVTLSGVSFPFFEGCHSAASCGKSAASEFVPSAYCPAQNGQPFPRMARFPTVDSHSCDGLTIQRHQTFRHEPA